MDGAHPGAHHVLGCRKHRRAAPALAPAQPDGRLAFLPRRPRRHTGADVLRSLLRKDFEKHRFWLIINALLFVGSGVFFFVPGPNIVAVLLRLSPGRALSVDAGSATGALGGGVADRGQRPSDRAAARDCTRACRSRAARPGRCPAPASRAPGEFLRTHRRAAFPRLLRRCRAGNREILTDALKLTDIAARIECRLEGDPDLEIAGVAGIDEAGPGDLTFFTNKKYAASLRSTRASAVILGDTAEAAPCAMLRTRHPYLAFARAVELFADPWRPPVGVHPTAAIGAGRRAWRRRFHRPLRRDRRRLEGRRALDRERPCRDRPRRRDRRGLHHSPARVDSRAHPHRPSRHRARRHRHRQRRLRLRPEQGRHPSEDPAARRRRH